MVRLSSIVAWQGPGPAEMDASRRLRVTAGVGLGLLFLTGPTVDLAQSSLPAARLAAVAVGLALFLAVYVELVRPGSGWYRYGPRSTLAGLATLLVLAVATRALGAPSSFDLLYVFFAAAIGMRLQPRAALVVIVATGVSLAVALRLAGESSSSYGAKGLSEIAIGAMMVAFARQIRVNGELRRARGEISRLAVADERLRIARDLHDLLGHSLSTIALKSELAARLVDSDPARAASELADVQDVSRQALAEVREAVQGYRQLALDDALAGARSTLAAAGIDCELEGVPADLPADVEEVFAWAVREATTNVVRHSGAERCAVRIRDGVEEAVIEVEDDGRSASDAVQRGSGLAGLAERVEAIRGRLEAGTAPGGGFLVRLVVPLHS